MESCKLLQVLVSAPVQVSAPDWLSTTLKSLNIGKHRGRQTEKIRYLSVQYLFTDRWARSFKQQSASINHLYYDRQLSIEFAEKSQNHRVLSASLSTRFLFESSSQVILWTNKETGPLIPFRRKSLMILVISSWVSGEGESPAYVVIRGCAIILGTFWGAPGFGGIFFDCFLIFKYHFFGKIFFV